LAKDARRGSGSLRINVSRANRALGPEIRITATAAGGGPEESAKIVSALLIPSGSCIKK
jgi:hypothetical protein